MKDWAGNSRANASFIGVNKKLTTDDRETHDYYATQPLAAELLMQIEDLSPNIWECACGEGHLAKVFVEKGYNVTATDLIDRGYGKRCDFLNDIETLPYQNFDGDIVTNPPYKYAQEFIEKGLDIVTEGHKVCMFLKLQYLEGKGRRKLFESSPPLRVWVSSGRIKCGRNGEFTVANMAAYAWYIWEKGYKGDTILKWFN